MSDEAYSDAGELWYSPSMDVFLNRWFSDYEGARRSLESEGGFLFPYGRHFFVCERDAVEAMGLDPDDEDFRKTGRDLARPADVEAARRLRDRRSRAAGS